MFATDLAIDLGTANTCVFAPGKGVVVNEPSVVALNVRTSAAEAVGRDASRMVGRTPENIRTVKPLKAGAIADYNGVPKVSHIRDKLVEMAHLNETIYGAGIAALSQEARSITARVPVRPVQLLNQNFNRNTWCRHK